MRELIEVDVDVGSNSDRTPKSAMSGGSPAVRHSLFLEKRRKLSSAPLHIELTYQGR